MGWRLALLLLAAVAGKKQSCGEKRCVARPKGRTWECGRAESSGCPRVFIYNLSSTFYDLPWRPSEAFDCLRPFDARTYRVFHGAFQRKAGVEPLVHGVSERIKRLVGWQLHLLLAPRAV